MERIKTKKDILEILCCPTCKSDLEIEIKKEEKDEIITGILICKKCKNNYKIEYGIPNLLPKKEKNDFNQ
ncbi:MAG: methytransferase partner Trm112 [Thermoplasmatales archaeon]|nr:MAG: methytransferase partner Trm112 [Thermoplasmatales archaeon]